VQKAREAYKECGESGTVTGNQSVRGWGGWNIRPQTAHLSKPYKKHGTAMGICCFEPEKFAGASSWRRQAGLIISPLHAIGDGPVKAGRWMGLRRREEANGKLQAAAYGSP